MSTVDELSIVKSLKNSARFYEGYNLSAAGCQCKRCRISRYRHTSEPHLTDFSHTYWQYLQYCMDQVGMDGLWMEFGVGTGTTLEYIANAQPDKVIYGFDSFEGLPEDWRISDEVIYPKGTYSQGGRLPQIPATNVRFVQGWFDVTLAPFLREIRQHCAFVHIDCDLYTSTVDVLRTLLSHRRIVPGSLILFDELYNYDGYAAQEIKALIEIVSEFSVKYVWMAHTESPVSWNGTQACLRITSVG